MTTIGMTNLYCKQKIRVYRNVGETDDDWWDMECEKPFGHEGAHVDYSFSGKRIAFDENGMVSGGRVELMAFYWS